MAIREGETIEVRGVDLERNPLDHATVTVAGFLPRRVAAGRFQLSGVRPGTFDLRVEADGFAAVEAVIGDGLTCPAGQSCEAQIIQGRPCHGSRCARARPG